jgi:uncharacterized protein (DUF302 family)
MASPGTGASQVQAGAASHEVAGVITKVSPRSVPETVSRLTEMVEGKGIKVFAVIDHSGEAERVGLNLRETKLVVFGSPKAGTSVMVAAPLAALDLPLKILLWDDDGQTRVSYSDPNTLARRYGLSNELVATLAVVGPLTDALVGP